LFNGLAKRQTAAQQRCQKEIEMIRPGFHYWYCLDFR
jgi:hypothetical protein